MKAKLSQSNKMALFFWPCKLANISIRPHFTPANLSSALCAIKAICILLSDSWYNSLIANNTAHSTAAELESPAPNGILPCMHIEKPPDRFVSWTAVVISVLVNVFWVPIKLLLADWLLLNTWSTTPII